MTPRELLAIAPVMPVLVIESVDDAVPLARALVDGGLRVLEVTMRTPAALDSVRAIRAQVPGAIAGVGTVVSRADLQAAIAAGAQFGVSPGATPDLLAAAAASGIPFLPGVATASEAMTALEHGFDTMKLFPAEQVGGIALLKALSGPLPQLRFCPTGGIDERRARDYLALANVGCVGGSWVAPAALVRARDFAAITRLATAAKGLRAAD